VVKATRAAASDEECARTVAEKMRWSDALVPRSNLFGFEEACGASAATD
jgi:hypothetical protein